MKEMVKEFEKKNKKPQGDQFCCPKSRKGPEKVHHLTTRNLIPIMIR